jgi:cysteinyl-tRNA synthetase
VPETRWLQPGPVTGSVGLSLDGLRAAGLDTLALRLAFMDRHYSEPLELTEAGLAASDAELRAWREQVAQWAKSPSRPMCAQYLQDFLTAFDRDLDTVAALAALRALAADNEIPAGSRFETFAYLDRLIGLDLAREVGRA